MAKYTASSARRVNLSTSEAEKAISKLTGWTQAQVNNIVLRRAQDEGVYIFNRSIRVIADDDAQTYTLEITEESDFS